MLLKVFVFLFLLNATAFADIYIYELSKKEKDKDHGNKVAYIACKNIQEDCKINHSANISFEDTQKLNESLSERDVVNISFTFQEPSKPSRKSLQFDFKNKIRDYEARLERFSKEKTAFSELFQKNSTVLFSVAAGNGFVLFGMNTPGVPLGKRYKIYPAIDSDYSNVLVVTAVDSKSKTDNFTPHTKIADYANYSVDYVDLAVPIETGPNQQTLQGTSYAAPYITRIGHKFLNLYPQINVSELTQIFLKSAHISNIEKTLFFTKDYIFNREQSHIFKIQNAKKYKIRKSLIDQLNDDILLVKSGGMFIEELAQICTQVYLESDKKLSIANACATAHSQLYNLSPSQTKDLKEFWKLRNI